MSKGQLKFARIHLLPAKEAPYVVVIRRKPSRKVHIMLWNTQTDEIEHGSWFSGRIYELDCDVSFDGKWLFYHADYEAGISERPQLGSGVRWESLGSWSNGGCFVKDDELVLGANLYWDTAVKAVKEAKRQLPFSIKQPVGNVLKGDDGVYIARLLRDGYSAQPKTTVADTSDYGPTVSLYAADERLADNWTIQPTTDHPVLRVTYLGHFENRGTVYRFDLPDYPDLLDYKVTSAAYDCLGQLIVARRGALERYTFNDIAKGKPSIRLDLEDLEPHPTCRSANGAKQE